MQISMPGLVKITVNSGKKFGTLPKSFILTVIIRYLSH